MTQVNLNALAAAFGASPAVAKGEVKASYWRGSEAVPRFAGTMVTLPGEMSTTITAGNPEATLNLQPTRGTCCVRWVITDEGTGARLVFFTEIPDVPAIGIGDLQRVDPNSYEATNVVVAAWRAAVMEVERIREEMSVAVAPRADWSGPVTLSQVETRSTFLRRRLTGAITLTLTPGTPAVAYTCTLELTQDAVGGRTLNVVGSATAYGTEIALSPGGDSKDLVHLMWTGSTWVAMAAATALSVPDAWKAA